MTAEAEVTQEEYAQFLAWKKGQAAPAAKAESQNGALCNQCDYDSRDPGEPAEGEEAAERDDSQDVAGDTLAALDHNASTGHHLTVKADGAGFQVSPRVQ